MAKKKKFRLIDAILSVICVVFVVEAAAPAAAIGNSQYFWWIFLIIAFLLPYGLIVSELGTTYDDEGGLYDWVKRAFGDKWASRVSWYYWINFPLWMASLAVLFPDTIAMITGFDIGTVPAVLIELAFIWIVVFISFSRVSDSTWILNLAAVLKVAIALVLGGLGIWFATQNGMATVITAESLLPDFTNLQSLTFLSIILFNFMGFEVIATFAGDMENPRSQIPKAIIAGGIAIAVVYLISSFGISAAIPTEDLSLDSGLIDAVAIMAGDGSLLFIIIAIVFLLTLFGNMISWSFGVNFVADQAAKNHDMPKPFGIERKSNDMPVGASVINGIVASILVIAAPFLDFGGGGFFWIFFAMNIVFLLLAYIPMFPAFLKLRKIDPGAERTFKVPGKGIVLSLIAWIPAILLILSIIATVVPLDGSEDEMSKIPMLIGVIVFVIIGEIIRIIVQRGKDDRNKPMIHKAEYPIGESPLNGNHANRDLSDYGRSDIDAAKHVKPDVDVSDELGTKLPMDESSAQIENDVRNTWKENTKGVHTKQ